MKSKSKRRLAIGSSDWLDEIALLLTGVLLGVCLGRRYQAYRMMRGVGPACLRLLDECVQRRQAASLNARSRDAKNCLSSLAASRGQSCDETLLGTDSIPRCEDQGNRLSSNEKKLSRGYRERG